MRASILNGVEHGFLCGIGQIETMPNIIVITHPRRHRHLGVRTQTYIKIHLGVRQRGDHLAEQRQHGFYYTKISC